ncbi:hypothetical protein F5884DRAFT_876864 [Xylogone sp. PMI_703]|nr:hypothetical protein F5884DRAFT_876864 [Xylogone sp. PMI_703]
MGKIEKVAQAKHLETLSPWTKEFVKTATTIPLPLLPQHLNTFPSRWPFPRGDLYHWVPLLNRFDEILELFCKTYKLDQGPQTRDFGRELLTSEVEPKNGKPAEQHAGPLPFGEDGDRELVEAILDFSRMLLENCGNRSIYASSSHLNNLLNTTSLSLLQSALLLGSLLAQRYQAALKRMSLAIRHVSSALLSSHYNIELPKVQQLSQPFAKTTTTTVEFAQPTTPVTPSSKGKEKAHFATPVSGSRTSTMTVYATDLVSIAKGALGVGSSPGGGKKESEPSAGSWDQWGDVKVVYYPKGAPDTEEQSTPHATISSPTPATPTPVRRSSNLGPNAQRANRSSNSDESPIPVSRSSTLNEEVARSSSKVIEIPFWKLKASGMHALLEQYTPGLPKEVQYELLTKLRIAHALTSSVESRRQILAIRLLAITNLAYIHPEPVFLEQVLKQDADEPRRLQLTYQLAELVHPPMEGEPPIPTPLQTIALLTLDALAQHQTKAPDICAALNTNVNHGILLYVVRKAVAEMAKEDVEDKATEEDDWREALFSLLSNVSTIPRAGSDLVTAGLIDILVEILTLRTSIAERYHPKVLAFMDNIVYHARDAFQALVDANGLDRISDLIVFEVNTASEKVNSVQGVKPEYKAASVDYDIPHFHQQTLKWVLKFIHHMMSTAGGYGGNFDRLLRNLIDSSQLLNSLRQIIQNVHRFGSIVWTNAVSILNDFINNEPTSFAVIAEAGLSKAFLEAVTGTEIVMESKKDETKHDRPDFETTSDNSDSDESDSEDEAPRPPTTAALQTPRPGPLAQGIMPTSDTIYVIPQAFGSICLNSAGMKMFQASRALESFFEIFESPEHVKCMEANTDLPSNLGSTFDELVRHHPPLKNSIMKAVLTMVARVGYLCKLKAENNGIGAKMWIRDAEGKVVPAGGSSPSDTSSKGKGKAHDEGTDVEMTDVDSTGSKTEPGSSSFDVSTSMTPYIGAVATFLQALFSNSSVRADFSTRGGIEYVLDLAVVDCLPYDFSDSPASRTLQGVIALLAEQKPHLVMPSLLKRTQTAVDALKTFALHSRKGAYFEPFIVEEAQHSTFPENPTRIVKALVNVLTLVSTLHQCFHASAFNHRGSNTGFNQLNLADYYIQLVTDLGPILGASLREEIALRMAVPTYWKSASKRTIPAAAQQVLDAVRSLDPSISVPERTDDDAPGGESGSTNNTTTAENEPATLANVGPVVPKPPEPGSAQHKNLRTLDSLFGKLPRTISPFFQTLGKALVTKRHPDLFQKQRNTAIAEALAETLLGQLNKLGAEEQSGEQFAYWVGLTLALKEMLIDSKKFRDLIDGNERPVQTNTLILQAFKERQGFDKLNQLLQVFTSEIRDTYWRNQETEKRSADTILRYEMATTGAKQILELYALLVNGKNITESIQTMSMNTRSDRDRSRPDQFSPAQFLVELRMAVLPTVRRLWESELIENSPSFISEKIIEVIRLISLADNESHAYKRSDKPTPPTKSPPKAFKFNNDNLTSLIAHEFDRDLAKEALYRCNNNISTAVEYCREQNAERSSGRNPIPKADITSSPERSSSRPETVASTGTSTPDDHAMAIDTSMIPPLLVSVNDIPSNLSPDEQSASQDSDHNGHDAGETPRALTTSSGENLADRPSNSSNAEEVPVQPVTVDDLNDERNAIREKLIDRCLDVINAHGEVTFEVADLITTVISKSSDPGALQKAIGETLVIALMSFEDVGVDGKKVAAYAHLLALLLQHRSFYEATVGELKENLHALLSFVKLSPTHTPEEPSPWIAQILLIFETLLSFDSKPLKTKWTAPKSENDPIETPVLEKKELVVGEEERVQLFGSILDILPRIGKDETLALAVLRILVILTRTRTIAQSLGEKKNIQRLFVMAKQLVGASSGRIQGPLMLILRHVIEDEETIKRIMRSEIVNFFESSRTQRSVDVHAYLRGLHQCALRAPELFVQITNEMVMFNRWTFQNPDAPSRPPSIVLKDNVLPSSNNTTDKPEDAVQPAVQATEDLTIQDVKPSTERQDSEMTDATKAAAPEHKVPIVENPDGVIHFLLCELLNYKDVEDKDPAHAGLMPTAPTSPTTEKTSASGNGDVSMSGTAAGGDTSSSKDSTTSKPMTKQDFKPAEHPIYVYRCFLLQCLTELLSSYNRTKIEFINFKRSAPPQAMTPSKPRSSIVNYLLFDLIPIGTLDHPNTTALWKKLNTSTWADSVLTALLSKTGEQILDRYRESTDPEDEPDLLFVRRFVLDHILKAYREASASTEPLDVKYARMLSLAELMSHIMSGKDGNDGPLASRSQAQLRRIMFEKGYIAALTASIADIDLNFPGAKRAVKYILRPLKALTQTAIHLSDLSLISSPPGQGEEEEIESATSVSDLEDEREETPDLFRNSTLGMFEPGREEDTSSESEDDDEEMYEGEYDEEMEYEEEMPDDDEDNISDEDEEIPGIGPIEGLPGDVDVEVIMEDDEDDDSSEEDDEDEDDEDDEDEDEEEDEDEDEEARVEIIDEDGNIHQPGDDDDMDEWESDVEDEEDYEGEAADQEEEEAHGNLMDGLAGGPLGHIVRALEGNDHAGAVEFLQRIEDEDLDADEQVLGEYLEDDDDDEDEDDDMDEDDMFEHGYSVDGHGPVDIEWEGEQDQPVIVPRGNLSRHRHGLPNPFPLFPGGHPDPLGGMLSLPAPAPVNLIGGNFASQVSRILQNPLTGLQALDNFVVTTMVSRADSTTVPDFRPSYRSHRPGGGAAGNNDDGINPLLRRSNSNGASIDSSSRSISRPTIVSNWVGPGGSEVLDIGFGRHPFSGNIEALLDHMSRSLPPGLARSGQALSFHITTSDGHSVHLPRGLQSIFGMSRGGRTETRRDTTEPWSANVFSPQSTSYRWTEETKLIFGPNSALERAMDLSQAIMAVLVPPAIEKDMALRAAQAERARKLEEEAKRKQEEERKAREAKEEEERIAREKKEAEEREAAEKAEAERLAAQGPESEAERQGESGTAEAMEGVETQTTSATGAEAGPAEERPRVTTVIRGSTYDITDLGIDAEFLAELPEEIREEVIMSAVAERRSQAAATGNQPSEIDQEFLDALPEDIRNEIMQQERQDRRRREREEQRRQMAANGGGVVAPDMDAASILATLPPAFRQQVLMEQDEEMIAQLPAEVAAQARALQREHQMHQGRPPVNLGRSRITPSGEGQESANQKPQRRTIVQMLDKSGVATLLRLMFIFQQGSLRNTLNQVLQNISLNRHNRAEVLSTLLHILQDGSADMGAVERSFAHLSLRAKQPKEKEKEPKTPQPLRKTLWSMGSLIQANSEASPIMVVQQCLSTLVYLTQVNPHVPSFFLTEHEPAGGLKRSLSRKGKAKDAKASKYALNSLLSLLDRELIMDSSSVMESLSMLLNMITQPLQTLERKQKEAANEAKSEEAQSNSEPVPSASSPEATSNNNERTEPSATAPQPDVPTPPQAAGNEGESSAPGDGDQQAKPATTSADTAEKKQRPLMPPVIPEHNLKLVINIFVARECSSKTFRETISTIKNLSAIPGAKDVFGRELIARAQELGELILKDLEELLPQIEKATSGTEIQGVALAKFSPGSSDQNKLLRVLTALDHLFDPKLNKKDKTEGETAEESSQLDKKQDLLSSLYENSTFGPMWDKLSACLRAIRQREHMLNVATILLPLIESLMVVCKNTSLKDTALARSQAGKELLLTSPPPESRMENLFFTFTEEHRKILNDLVRHTPKLMSGTFSLLVKNPKVLEFDNKRNYFSRSIHNRNQSNRQSYPPLQLSVRRDQVFHDSFKSLYFQTGDQMKYGKLSIRFHGEEGVDAGGVTREWFQVLSRQMFDPGYALFIPVSSDRTTFHPNQLSGVNEEHLMFFKFIGRIIGKALYEGRVLDCHFSRAVYKSILGKPVSIKDMESLDPDYYKSLVWMLENDINDIITETFSVDNDKFGVVETIDFIPNGRNIAVTDENKHEYVRLMVEWRLTGSVKEQLSEFLKGFHEIIPAELIAIFNEQELELLISGLPEIDVDDWKSNTEYHNYTGASPQIQWFWRAVRSFDKEERAKLLQFVTGTSKVPLNGFKELEGMNGFSRFNIHRDYGNKDRLPSSHTCFNQLDLPEYESYESLRQHLLMAITAGSEYFGFA